MTGILSHVIYPSTLITRPPVVLNLYYLKTLRHFSKNLLCSTEGGRKSFRFVKDLRRST